MPDSLVSLDEGTDKESVQKEKITRDKSSKPKVKKNTEKKYDLLDNKNLKNGRQVNPADDASEENKEETFDKTIGFYQRHMEYINNRIGHKYLSSGGKSGIDFTKEVREIIDEAIRRDGQ
jgi:hypothetical protein